MIERRTVTVDGNEAAASVAHRTTEVIAIYPITPSSSMGELSDEWSSQGKKNIWGTVPAVIEMQSEGGVAGVSHGIMQSGVLTTSFTSSQGLLLFIPDMYKMAGELTPFVLHVAARTIATHALSIFGDHSDVMSCRQTGFAMLSADSVQQVHDFALIAQASTMKSRVPFIHFFDGFRTSHEVSRIEMLSDDDLRSMITDDMVADYRSRALTPDHPVLRGTTQNSDTYFQAREACNTFYNACPDIVQAEMDAFSKLTGRSYSLFDYFGHPDAERVVVIMGSGASTAHEYVEWALSKGEKIGVLKVRLFRPFSIKHFVDALPKTVKNIAVLDRCKEPGAVGDPLYLDIVTALVESQINGTSHFDIMPKVFATRYGLASKEFTPGCLKAIYDNLAKDEPKNHSTVGIIDDVTLSSLLVDQHFDIERSDVKRAIFYGLGSDGTVGANKNSIKIIAEETPNYGQGYFVYDSKKAGAITISHLRFGPRPIHSAYLIKKANFIACHNTSFLDKYDMLSSAAVGATFLLNTPVGKDKVWDSLPLEVQSQIIDSNLKFYIIDAYKVAKATGMGMRINTIMQTCFFAISGVLPREEAILHIKQAIKKTYGKKGDAVVQKNFEAVDHTLVNLVQVEVADVSVAAKAMPPTVSEDAPEFVQRVTAIMMSGKGDLLPTSAFPVDGTWPTNTTRWEKRNIAMEIPAWDKETCIQCNKCSVICPHAAIRPKVYAANLLKDAPDAFKSVDYKGIDFKGFKYTLQVAPEDCTGCGICVAVCPAKNKTNIGCKAINMVTQSPIRSQEVDNFNFFLNLPEADRSILKSDVKSSQFMEPLFEFSGACSGCGETPYVKLMTQMFGDRAMVANATGCSSIYGGNLPTTPYTKNKDGRGPAWSNSLFEDNAEFGLGFRVAIDKNYEYATELLTHLTPKVGDELVISIVSADQSNEAGIKAQRNRILELQKKLAEINTIESRRLSLLADYLVKKSVWIVGGDGWACDIGYGGLDHVIASGRNVNILVLDTEVYSNTGGQASKSTPIGASAKFATAGKALPKKDLGLMAMSYGNVYVARVAIGANDAQTVKAFREAESYDGPSLIIAYSHCIAHGFNLISGCEQQKLAVNSGHWPLFRYDPRRITNGEGVLQMDSPAPKVDLRTYILNENRYRMLEQRDPERFKHLLDLGQVGILNHYALYEHLARFVLPNKLMENK
jgi:pyruvate-ferredoxin/flavodoxin oxidoreductase